MRGYTVDDFLRAIDGSNGIKKVVTDRLGCGRDTFDRWLRRSKKVRDAWEAECDRFNDVAQSVLVESIKAGNTQDAKWWLARKRRSEFGDGLDLTTSGEQVIRVVGVGINVDEL